MQYTVISPIGPLTVTTMDDHITSVLFDGGYSGSTGKTNVILSEVTSVVTKSKDLSAMDTNKKKIQKQLDDYFAGKLRVFDLPLLYQGTPFQMKVWKYLQAIPYGQTTSYREVAQAIGHPKSARAVGTACKRNPIPVIIPCHRVVRSDGQIGRYAGGVLRKIRLLSMERSVGDRRRP